jgi:hypothetical protein
MRGMLNPDDYYRAARYLIGEYGPAAGDRAASRAAQLAAEGCRDVHEMWRLLAVTVREIEERAHRRRICRG